MRLAVLAAVLAASLLGVAPAAMGQSQPPAVGMGASHWTATYDTTDYQPYVWSSGDGYQETVAWEKATIVASDPRISGSWSQVRDIRAFPNGVPGGPDIWVSSATARIDNADGAWTGTFNGGYEVRDGGFGEEWNMFQGEGAYSGLTAVFHWRSGDAPNLEGVIVPSGLPPTPHAIPSPTP